MTAESGHADPDTVEDLKRLRGHVAQTAHDLANALGAIQNYCTFLREDLPDSQEAQLYLSHLDHATRRALDLVEKLSALR